ncbi:MAG TPA: NrtA/SsuA/CpmA family ABC transporter substrate-binding protein [Methanotrichaceae archaeon]|nr:NrtA/SsuA/CpmA family ABC transporter substrate-binding protein [Methanotrichaceae archaeon]
MKGYRTLGCKTMNKNAASMCIIVALVLIGFSVWYFISYGTTFFGTPEPITIGGPALEQSAFIYIAQDQGFFAMNGLDVTIRDDYPNGVIPVNDMLKGVVDISVSAEYPVITQAFKKENISIIGSIDRYQNENIIGRKDRGIENISDLKGKKIGIPRGTICEFFLGRFLNLNGMSLQDVALMDVPASTSVDAIANGEVDAIIYYQPYIHAIINRLGGNAIIWPAQSNQLLYGVLACRDDWAAEHPLLINRFLRSIALAEEYMINNPDEARAIVQKRLNFTDKYMAAVWPDHQFSLSLDQSLLIAMNDEGRWAINNNLTTEKTMPDFRDYVDIKSLEAVKPAAVNIR